MPDDIISLGGGGRGRFDDGAGETIESVFAALYARMVRAARGLTEDRDLAEELVLAAFVRLARRSWGGRRGLELEAAARFLQRAVTRLSGARFGHRRMERRARRRGVRSDAHGTRASAAGLDLALPEAPSASTDESGSAGAQAAPADVARAWREFQVLRARSAWRLRGFAATGVLVVALAIALPVVAIRANHGLPPGSTVPGPPGGNPQSPGLNPRRMPIGANKPIAPPAFEDAIVARIGLSGVLSVTGSKTAVWAIRSVERARGGLLYQLDRIDLRTNQVTLRRGLGRQQRSVTAGGGMVWLTTARGRAGGQLVRIDPATGRVRQRLHLPAGRCGYVGYSGGQLVANCQVNGPFTTDFLGIDPATGRVRWQEGASPVPAQIGAIAPGPRSVWYVASYVRNSGLAATGGSVRAVSAGDPAYRGSKASYATNASTRSLAYGRGSVWVLSDTGNVARIDPVTGSVQRVYSRSGYDPRGYAGLNYLAVGDGGLWFLEAGGPFNGVLRVSPATGSPVGLVAIPASLCGQQSCTQIDLTPGAVWVPTRAELIRIDPARTPPPDLFPQTIHHELAVSRPYARTGGGTLPALHVGSAP